MPGHPLDAASRRCRRRAEVDTAAASRIWIQPRDRTEDELPPVLESAGEIPANIVLVIGLDLGRAANAATYHEVSEPRREALHLCFDAIRHVDR